jgi:signal transduction histidine kinase
MLHATDLLLRAALQRIQGRLFANGAEMQLVLATEEFSGEIASLQRLLPQAAVLSVFDARGRTVACSCGYPAPPFDVGDREFFQALAGGASGLELSEPLQVPDGGGVLYLARRLLDAHGRFAGVAGVGLSLEQIQASFATIDAGAGSTITLLGQNGMPLVRWPDDTQAATLPLLLDAGQRDDRGTELRTITGKDQPPRRAASHWVSGYPLQVAVIRNRSALLAPWMQQLAWIAGFAGSSIVMILVLTMLVQRMLRAEQSWSAALASSEAELRFAVQAKSDFLSNMSHELRSPLNAILGFSKMIDGQVRGPLNAEYVSWAQDIHASADHLLNLVNDILDLSKIEAGCLGLDEEVISLPAVCEQSVRMLRAQADAAGVGLALQRDDPHELVTGDERRLLQIAINLISNAIKYTQPGGSIVVGLDRSPAGEPQFWVLDTGIGIAPDDLQRVMGRFVQLKTAANARTKGTGIGLPLTRELVELHGGRLVLESAVGQGTKALVTLPAERAVELSRDAQAARVGTL